MSEYRFGITGINADLHTQDIEIAFSLHLDEDTLSAQNIILTVNDKGAQRVVPFELLVDERVVTLHLNEWAVPNQEYTLLIQPGVESVTGERLDSAVVRNFIFTSAVSSEVEIANPADFEKVSLIHIDWAETGKSPTGNYYLEIAQDAAFYNIVRKTETSNTAYDTGDLDAGQYFVRVRAQNSEQDYGCWSDVHTFLYAPVSSDDGAIVPPDDSGADDDGSTSDDTTPSDGPVVIIDKPDSFTIQTVPDNGITPPHFDFVFSSNINITGAKVEITREAF